MKEELTVLSLFDGKSCGLVSLKELGFKIGNYYASEIDEPAIRVSKKRHKDIIHVGDVRLLNGAEFSHVNFVIGGSPCQSFSMMGKRKGMTTKCEMIVDTLEKYLKLKSEGFEFVGQSYLYWELVRIYTEIKEIRGDKPTYFFLENVKMTKHWENIISNGLGVKPLRINSSRVTPQNRDRFYWTNLPGVTIPEDQCMTLDMIIPNAVTGSGTRGKKVNGNDFYTYHRTNRKDKIANTLVTQFGTVSHGTCQIELTDGSYRVISPEEGELLQGLKPGYTKVEGVSQRSRVKMIGNGWTIGVIKHLFKSIENIQSIAV